MKSNMDPNPVKNDFFQKWPQTLGEGQTDLSGPVLSRSMAIPNTGDGYTVRETGKVQHKPKTSQKRDLFQMMPRTLWECETDLKRLQ